MVTRQTSSRVWSYEPPSYHFNPQFVPIWCLHRTKWHKLEPPCPKLMQVAMSKLLCTCIRSWQFAAKGFKLNPFREPPPFLVAWSTQIVVPFHGSSCIRADTTLLLLLRLKKGSKRSVHSGFLSLIVVLISSVCQYSIWTTPLNTNKTRHQNLQIWYMG